MSVTAGDLYARGRAVLGLNQQDGRLDDNNIVNVVQIINAALMEFSAEHDWDFLYDETTFTTVAGVEKYLLPTDHLRTSWVADADNNELHLRQRRDHIRHRSAQSQPYFYSVIGDYLYLSPTPDSGAAGTYRHGYFRHLPELPDTVDAVADLDVLTYKVPVVFQPMLQLFIAKHVALSLKDYDAYRLVNEELDTERRRLADNVRRALGPVAPQTRSW